MYYKQAREENRELTKTTNENEKSRFELNSLFYSHLLILFHKHRAGFNMATTPEFEMLQNNLKYKAHSSLTSIQDVGRSERSTPARSRSISRQTSVISIASLDLQMQESGSRPMSTLRDILSGETRNLRMGSILYLLLFSCLLFGTLSDVICRMKTGDARHHAKKHKSYDNDKKGILGSAMISSLTGALSPILPFAGGVDLRRDNAWKSWR